MPLSTCTVTRSRLPARRAASAPSRELFGAVDDRNQIGGGAVQFRAGRNAVQDVDFVVRAERVAQSNSLADMSDEKRPAAFLEQRIRHLCRAQSVGVGLHNGGAIAVRHALPQPAEIFANRAQVDGEDGARLFEGRHVVHIAPLPRAFS